MGVLIEAAVALHGGHGPGAASSLALTDRAAAECLRAAGRDASEIDLLISTGIYHDRNLAEPALAALVQEDMGANLGHPPVGGHGTFSFDLMNGTCGPLSAAHLADGFMRSRAVDLAMVVAGDAEPRPSRGFTFTRSGAAMLLRWNPGDAGFYGFHFRTFPEYQDLFVSTLAWESSRGPHLPLQHH
ncbi:MAG TPA: 3-oxoacyl-ACP synthase, partial [Candidatus Dormibacteraeota bacterium]|nr:3-oxoacyl-ACP synthase [Candidatus Dormibacteraeota bacterium]